jgi:putative hydrolase of the HAD superfamily
MDNVLYDYDWTVRMRRMSRLTGLSTDEMRRRWWLTGFEQDAEAGAYPTGAEYLVAFCEVMGVEIEPHDWVRVRGSAMTPFPASIAAVKRASELGQITLLTNAGPLAGEHLTTLAPDLAPLFGDHLFSSSSYGARKPDPAVFVNVLARYGVEPEDAFFADDLQENVDGARSIGITGHRFTTPDVMSAAIEAFAASRGVGAVAEPAAG